MISTKFVGPAKVHDRATGLFWEVLPALGAHDERLQRALIGRPLVSIRDRVNSLPRVPK